MYISLNHLEIRETLICLRINGLVSKKTVNSLYKATLRLLK